MKKILYISDYNIKHMLYPVGTNILKNIPIINCSVNNIEFYTTGALYSSTIKDI